jgi:hypothetical protein
MQQAVIQHSRNDDLEATGKFDKVSGLSRRSIIAAVAVLPVVALPVAAKAMPARHEDDPAWQAWRVARQIDEDCPGDEAGAAAEERWTARWQAARDRLVATKATTPMGLAAKLKFGINNADTAMMLAVVEELVGWRS